MSDLMAKTAWLQRHGDVVIANLPRIYTKGWRASFEGEVEVDGVKLSLTKEAHGKDINEAIDALHSSVSGVIARLGVESFERDDDDEEED